MRASPCLKVLLLPFLSACAPLGGLDGFDDGAAEVTLQRGDAEPLQLVHNTALSDLSLTPPVDGIVELSFAFQDPFVTLTLRVDANAFPAGERVPLPTEAAALRLAIAFDDVSFVSTAPGAQGALELQVLEVGEDSAALSAFLDVDLPSEDASLVETLAATGFVEASYGDPAAALDEAMGLPLEEGGGA